MLSPYADAPRDGVRDAGQRCYFYKYNFYTVRFINTDTKTIRLAKKLTHTNHGQGYSYGRRGSAEGCHLEDKRAKFIIPLKTKRLNEPINSRLTATDHLSLGGSLALHAPSTTVAARDGVRAPVINETYATQSWRRAGRYQTQ